MRFLILISFSHFSYVSLKDISCVRKRIITKKKKETRITVRRNGLIFYALTCLIHLGKLNIKEVWAFFDLVS